MTIWKSKFCTLLFCTSCLCRATNYIARLECLKRGEVVVGTVRNCCLFLRLSITDSICKQRHIFEGVGMLYTAMAWSTFARFLGDLVIQCALLSSQRHLRSAERNLLHVSCHRLNTCGFCHCCGPSAWNSLPDPVRIRTLPNCFRTPDRHFCSHGTIAHAAH